MFLSNESQGSSRKSIDAPERNPDGKTMPKGQIPSPPGEAFSENAKAVARPAEISHSLANLFLEGNFAPIENEYTLTHNADFEIRGKIPKDLNGSFYRNGPNPQHAPGENYHWFLGDGMVHAFHFKRGEVSYRNRYMRTPTFEIEKRAGRNIFLEGGFNPLAQLSLLGGNFLSLLSGLVRHGNADVYTRLIAKANTSLVAFREEVYALVESSPPWKINPATLESFGFENFDAHFIAPFSAHPKIDPTSGYLYNFGYRVSGKPKLEYFVVNPSGKLVGRTAIDTPYHAMVHDFVITRNYAVLPVFPAVASLSSLRKGRIAEWQPQKGAFVYVLAKAGDKESLRRFEMPPCYIYHYANAYEDGKAIVFDAVRYESLPLMGDDSAARRELFQRENNGTLTRFRLDLVSGKVEETPLSADLAVEFPVIDNRLTGENYEHTFAGAAKAATSAGFFDRQAAFDMAKGKMRIETSEFPQGHFGGEPIFVPTGKPGQKKGYLLNLIYDSGNEVSYLGIWDAARIDKKPVCEIGLKHRIPYGFHGLWRPYRA